MRKLTAKVVISIMILSVLLVGVGSMVEAATYNVQPGDSLWTIARKFKTTVNNLKQLNNNWSNRIYVGQKLQVPGVSGWTYTVKSGDSLWSIAKRVGVSVNAIKQVNGLYTSKIRIGQRLTIPSGGSTTAGSTPKLSNSEIDLLARVIYAEARGESYTGQVAVGAVLLNRVQDSRFPKTLNGVVFQKNAFETVSNGQIWKQPNNTAYKAARAALNGQDPTGGALYFYNPAKITNPKSWIWTRRVTLKIGNHNFAI